MGLLKIEILYGESKKSEIFLKNMKFLKIRALWVAKIPIFQKSRFYGGFKHILKIVKFQNFLIPHIVNGFLSKNAKN